MFELYRLNQTNDKPLFEPDMHTPSVPSYPNPTHGQCRELAIEKFAGLDTVELTTMRRQNAKFTDL
jgi:hypothetical protein